MLQSLKEKSQKRKKLLAQTVQNKINNLFILLLITLFIKWLFIQYLREFFILII